MIWIVIVYTLGFAFALWAIVAPWYSRTMLAIAWPLPIAAFACKWLAISLIWVWHKFGDVKVEED